MFNKRIVYFILLLIFQSQFSLSNQIQDPQSLNDGWEVSTLEKEGFQVEKLKEVERLIHNDKHHDLQSISVFINNKIVYDKHLNGSTYSSITDIRSATKSFVSALIGIAIDKADIPHPF
ncbi:MAG: hypothetical protein ACI936_004051 [Paraglaciecola sp.]|jgi:hypothetical protein